MHRMEYPTRVGWIVYEMQYMLAEGFQTPRVWGGSIQRPPCLLAGISDPTRVGWM